MAARQNLPTWEIMNTVNTLTMSQCTLAGPVYIPVYTGIPLKCHWLTRCILGDHLGLQFIWNQCSSDNSRYTSCILSVVHAGKWPDLMTSKTAYVNTLGYHWIDYTGTIIGLLEHTGRPLEGHWHYSVHWGLDSRHTGLPLNYHWITTGSG